MIEIFAIVLEFGMFEKFVMTRLCTVTYGCVLHAGLFECLRSLNPKLCARARESMRDDAPRH